MLEGLRHQPTACGLAGEVPQDEPGFSALRPDAGDHPLAFSGMLRKAMYDDTYAVLGKGAGDSGADAARRAGNQSHAAGEGAML